MRFISTKFHGVLDYLSGILFIASPWLFNFADGSYAQKILVIAGIIVMLMSVMTNYEAGLIKRIPMATHLYADILLGIILLISPWLFNFYEYVALPYIIFGVLSIGAGLFTEKTPNANIIRNRFLH